MGRYVIPDHRLPEPVQEIIKAMEDSHTSEGTTVAELINDVASGAIDGETDPKEAMIGSLDELVEWVNATKKELEEAFKG